MTAYLDIIGSVLIGGLILLAVFNLNAQVMDRSLAASLSLMAQTNGAATAEIVERDLRRIGLGVEPDSARILSANPSALYFQGDVDGDGTVELVRYRRGALNFVSPNPSDYIILRVVDGALEQIELGAARFQFSYYDAAGLPTTTIDEIREIELDFRAEVSEAYRYWDEVAGQFVEEYPGSDFKFRVRPKNM